MTPFILMIALSVHSIFEGLALGLATTEAAVMNMVIAILAHKGAAGSQVSSEAAPIQRTTDPCESAGHAHVQKLTLVRLCVAAPPLVEAWPGNVFEVKEQALEKRDWLAMCVGAPRCEHKRAVVLAQEVVPEASERAPVAP